MTALKNGRIIMHNNYWCYESSGSRANECYYL